MGGGGLRGADLTGAKARGSSLGLLAKKKFGRGKGGGGGGGRGVGWRIGRWEGRVGGAV